MERELRALRAKNAKLMTSNLSTLMAVREAEADVEELLVTLRSQCAALERAGVAAPEKCQALLEQRADEDVAMGGGDRPEDRPKDRPEESSSAREAETPSSASGPEMYSTDEL